MAVDGSVSSLRPESIEGVGNTLRFLVTDVSIDVGNYASKYMIYFMGWKSGNIQTGLIRGNNYWMQFGSSSNAQFRVEADGTVTTTAPDSLEILNTTVPTIRFKTVDVHFNVNGLSLKYMPSRDFFSNTVGNQTVKMVPGLDYQFTVVFSWAPFTYHVGVNGNVSLVSTDIIGNTPTISGNTITLHPLNVHVETASTYWKIYGGANMHPLNGSQTFYLLPNIHYSIASPGGFPGNHFGVTEGCQFYTWEYDYVQGVHEVFPTGNELILPHPNGSTFTLTSLCNEAPLADAGTGQDIFLSEMANLDGSASSDPDGDPLSFTWSIYSAPTGSTASLLGANTDSPSLIPNVTGQYIISLMVNDGTVDSAADTVIINVTENLPPVADATAIPLTGDAPLNVSFSSIGSSDPDGNIVAIEWDFGDGSPVSSIPSHSYGTPGVYTAILTVTDDFSNTDQASVEITVTAPNTPPSADATATPASGEAPHETRLMANASDPEGDPLSYSWDFGDGSPVSTVANPLHTYNAPGTYEATVTVSDGEFTVTSMAPVNVSSALKINVCEAKVKFGKPGKVKDKVNFKAKFDFSWMLTHSDLITVVFDGETIIEEPFSSFREEAHEPGEYKFKRKNVQMKLDFNKGEMKVFRGKMLLGGLDNSNGINVHISLGASGTDTDHFVMKAKGHHDDDDDDKKKKLSFKDKCGKDKHEDKHGDEDDD